MKFKFRTDSEAQKRKKLAAKALEEMRKLRAANYPVAMRLDLSIGSAVERGPGETITAACARRLGMNLEQLRDFCKGTLDTGLFHGNSAGAPSHQDLVNNFTGWSALLIAVEDELASQSGG